MRPLPQTRNEVILGEILRLKAVDGTVTLDDLRESIWASCPDLVETMDRVEGDRAPEIRERLFRKMNFRVYLEMHGLRLRPESAGPSH